MATSIQRIQNETIVTRSVSYDHDIVDQLVSLNCGTRDECLAASRQSVDCKNVNEVLQHLEHAQNSPHTYQTKHLTMQKSTSISKPALSTLSVPDYTNDEKNGDMPQYFLKRSTPFFTLMESLSSIKEDMEYTKNTLDDETDSVQLYVVIRDITDKNNHNDLGKKVLLLTHPLLSNVNTSAITIMKCLIQRVFREDNDSDYQITNDGFSSPDDCASITRNTSIATSHASFPSFSQFSQASELELHLLSPKNTYDECFAPNAQILSTFSVQAKVIEFIRYWVSEYWNKDWTHNIQLKKVCKSFIRQYRELDKINLTEYEANKGIILIQLLERTIKNCINCSKTRKLSHILGAKVEFSEFSHSKSSKNIIIPPLMPVLSSTSSQAKIEKCKDIYSETDSKTIAGQITLIQFQTYSQIHPRECLDEAWKKVDKAILAPNISNYIDQFNKITKWVQFSILSAKNVKHRSLTIKRWIKVGNELYKLKNFMGVSVIRCALNSNEIFKLRTAWDLFEKKHSKHLKEYNAFSKLYQRSNWKDLREIESNNTESLIPYFPMFATDMIGIGVAHQKRVQNGTINFSAFVKIHQRIESHLMHQKREYKNIKMNATVQRWINEEMINCDKLDTDQLFAMSKDVINKDKST